MIDLLEHGLAGHRVDVVLVRRPARPVACRCDDLDEEEPVGREFGRDEVADVSRRMAGAADLEPDGCRIDDQRLEIRRRWSPWTGASAIATSVEDALSTPSERTVAGRSAGR